MICIAKLAYLNGMKKKIGRPCIRPSGEPSTVLSFRADPQFARAFKEVCDKNGVTRNSVLEIMVYEYVNDQGFGGGLTPIKGKAPIALKELRISAASIPHIDMTGVYQIYSIADDRSYIGSAARSFRDRWVSHVVQLRKGIHGNRHFQKAWVAHDQNSFEFSIIELCNAEICLERESHHLASFPPDKLFNVRGI